MSTAPPGSSGAVPPAPVPPRKREITLISHSMLFYWWPIWLLGFTMAAITFFEDDRLAVMPPGTGVTEKWKDEGNTYYEVAVPNSKGATKSLTDAVKRGYWIDFANFAIEFWRTR